LGVLAAEVENDHAAEFGVGALVVLLHLCRGGHCAPLLLCCLCFRLESGSKTAALQKTVPKNCDLASLGRSSAAPLRYY